MGVPGLSTLTKQEVEIADLMARGFNERVIAGRVGLPLTTVHRKVKLKKVQDAAQMFASGAVDDVLEIRTANALLERAAPRAAERLVELLEMAEKDSDVQRVAEAILDRTGHAKKTEVTTTTILLDAEMVKQIEETRGMLQSQEIEEAEYEILEDEYVRLEKDRLGNSRDDSDGRAGGTGGSVDGGELPVRSSDSRGSEGGEGALDE